MSLDRVRPWAGVIGGVVGVVLVLLVARWSGAAAALTAREQVVADSAAAVAVRRVAVARDRAIAAGRAYAKTVAPHVDAQRASDRTTARTPAIVTAALATRDSALAAAADSSRQLPELRGMLVQSAWQIGAIAAQLRAVQDTLGQERIAAALRIRKAEDRIVALERQVAAADALEDARQDQIDVAKKRRPWYQRALGAACEITTTAGGAGLGALAGGVGGAIGGAGLGLGAGKLACR